eukprot:gene23140-43587_t
MADHFWASARATVDVFLRCAQGDTRLRISRGDEAFASPMNFRAPLTHPRTFSLRCPATAFALLVLAGSADHLAAAETPPAPAASKTATVEMLPFLVATDKDTGYAAADTISSGRLSTNLLM